MKYIKYIVFIIILVITIALKIDNCEAYVINNSYNRSDYNLGVDNYYSFKGEYIDDKHLELNIGFESSTYSSPYYSEPIIIYYDISPEMSKSEVIKYKAQLLQIIYMLDNMQIDYAVIPAGTDVASLAVSLPDGDDLIIDSEDTMSQTYLLSFIASQRLTLTWVEKLKNTVSTPSLELTHNFLYSENYKIINITSSSQPNFYTNSDDKIILSCQNNKITIKDENDDNTYYGELYNLQYGYKISNNFCNNTIYTDETNLYTKVEYIVQENYADRYNTKTFTFSNNFDMFEIESINDIEASNGKITSFQETSYLYNGEEEPVPVEITYYNITVDNYDCTNKQQDDVYQYNIKIKLKLKDEYYNDSSLDGYDVSNMIYTNMQHYDAYDGLEKGTDSHNLDYYIPNKFDFYVNDTYKETYKIGDIVNLEDYETDFENGNNSDYFLGLYVDDDIAKKITTKTFYMPGEDVYAKSIYATNEIHKYTNDLGLNEMPPKATMYSLYNADLTNDNINIIFANHCWEYISDDDKGAKKLIYNGEPDDFGMCGSDRKDHTGISERSNISIYDKQDFFTDYRYNEANGKYYLTGEHRHYESIDMNQDYDDLRGLFFCEGSLGTLNSCDQIYSIGERVSSNTSDIYAHKITNDINYDSIGNTTFNQNNGNMQAIGYMYQTDRGGTRYIYLNRQTRVVYSRDIPTTNVSYATSYQIGNAHLVDPDNDLTYYDSNNVMHCDFYKMEDEFIIINYNSIDYVAYVKDISYNYDNIQNVNFCNADAKVHLWKTVNPNLEDPNVYDEVIIEDILNDPSFTGEYSDNFEFPITFINEGVYDPSQDDPSILVGKYIITDRGNSSQSVDLQDDVTTIGPVTAKKYELDYVTEVYENQLNIISDYVEAGFHDVEALDITRFYYADSYSYNEENRYFYLENSDNSTVQRTSTTSWANDMAGKEEFYMCLSSTSCKDIIYVKKAGPNGYTYYLSSLLFGEDRITESNLVYSINLYTANNYVKKFDGANLKYICHDEYSGIIVDDDNPFTCATNEYLLDVEEIQTSGTSVNLGGGILKALTYTAPYNPNTELQYHFFGDKDSVVKDVIDRWYEHNLTKYSKYIVDSTFNQGLCYNDVNTFNQNEHTFDPVEFLNCNDPRSVYSVSEEFGNGKLTYPIGIFNTGLTAKSESYWVGTVPIGNYYDYLNDKKNLTYYNASRNAIDIASGTEELNIRPVINITSGIEVIGGEGTISSPYVLDDGSQFSEEYKNRLKG